MLSPVPLLKRYPDWAKRLRAAVEARCARPHAWGSFDCVLAAADLVHVQTGADLAAAFRGTYSDEAGARALLSRLADGTLAGLLDTVLPRRIERPRRGDVLILPGQAGDYVATSWMGGAVAPDATGLRWRPAPVILGCWGVG